MMSNIISKTFVVSSVLMCVNSASATSQDPLSKVVTPVQADNIVKAIPAAAGAPSGTEVSNVSLSGDYFLDDKGYLATMRVSSLNFTVKVPLLFFKATDNVHVEIYADFPNGDCANPVNVNVTSKGDNALVDLAISKYLKDNSVDIIKNYFIKMTGLVDKCAIQPKLEHSVTFY